MVVWGGASGWQAQLQWRVWVLLEEGERTGGGEWGLQIGCSGCVVERGEKMEVKGRGLRFQMAGGGEG